MLISYRFRLSELEEFYSVLREKNKEVFIKRFSEYVKQLLRDRMFMLNRDIAFPNRNDEMGCCDSFLQLFCEEYENTWKLLKEMMVFSPDFFLLNKVVRHFEFLDSNRRSFKEIFRKGVPFWRSVRNYCSMRRRLSKMANFELTFQDMFSVAAARFSRMAWGNGKEFQRLFESASA